MAPTADFSLLTTCGPVDVLVTLGQGDGYDQLLEDVIERKIGDHRKPRDSASTRLGLAAAEKLDKAIYTHHEWARGRHLR